MKSDIIWFVFLKVTQAIVQIRASKIEDSEINQRIFLFVGSNNKYFQVRGNVGLTIVGSWDGEKQVDLRKIKALVVEYQEDNRGKKEDLILNFWLVQQVDDDDAI